MNKTKIARYYPFYLDMLRTKAAQPQRTLLGMMENQLRAETLLASARRFSVGLKDCGNPQRRYDYVGCVTDELLREFVPARVFNWAHLQVLTLPVPDDFGAIAPTTGWEAYLQAGTSVVGLPGQPAPALSECEPTLHVRRQGTAQDFAPLLRGLRAYQAKLHKRARRLLAQLWTYHWQQQVARQLVTVEPALVAEGRMTV